MIGDSTLWSSAWALSKTNLENLEKHNIVEFVVKCTMKALTHKISSSS